MYLPFLAWPSGLLYALSSAEQFFCSIHPFHGALELTWLSSYAVLTDSKFLKTALDTPGREYPMGLRLAPGVGKKGRGGSLRVP